jgi:hypothetical protein
VAASDSSTSHGSAAQSANRHAVPGAAGSPLRSQARRSAAAASAVHGSR